MDMCFPLSVGLGVDSNCLGPVPDALLGCSAALPSGSGAPVFKASDDPSGLGLFFSASSNFPQGLLRGCFLLRCTQSTMVKQARSKKVQRSEREAFHAGERRPHKLSGDSLG